MALEIWTSRSEEKLLRLMALLGDEREPAMAKRIRRTHAAVFKAHVALAALAQWFDVHPYQITEWQRPLRERAVGRDLWRWHCSDGAAG